MPNKLIALAAERLRAGGVVAFPTETVYGLGADARNEDAVRRVFAMKGRPAEHPLIVHLAEAAQADAWAAEITEPARRLMARFWPGSLTLVLLAQGLRVAVLRRNRSLHGKPLLPPLPQFLLPAHAETYARSLYGRLRELDRFAFDRLLVEAPPLDETWWAVNDRLARAATGSGRKARP